jgi:hypothetical protein
VAKPQDRDLLISEMVRPGAMAEMLDDNFANYVVQTALDYSEGEQREQLLKELVPLLNTIKSRSWYKRIMTKIGMGMSTISQFEPPRHIPSRQFVENRVPRMASQRPLTHMVYGQAERSVEQPPPGFMHPNPVGGQLSDRNGYRPQQVQSHTSQQYGNFYPYAPRAPIHQSEYRTNGDY